MDDKIKAALQGIISKQHAQQRPGSAQERHAAADSYIALWNSKQKQVVKPAFKEFSQHLATEYKIDSCFDDSLGMEVLTVISDPGIRFIFGERPMFGDASDASFFELRCVSASQTLKASFEVHKGEDVESGTVEGTVTLNDLTADWIHQQLTKVLAKSYGQELPTEETPPPEPMADETQRPDASSQETPSPEAPEDAQPPSDAPAQETSPPESPPEESPRAQPEAPKSSSATDSTNVQAPDANPQDNQAPDDAANAQNPAQDPKDPPP